jgi:hypothetical protein
MDELKTKTNEMDLRDIAPGFIRFSIKADDTAENQSVHEAFREFCKIETDNNYTQGLRKLLEYYQSDFKYEMIYNKLQDQSCTLDDLRESVIQLQSKPKKEVKNDGTF